MIIDDKEMMEEIKTDLIERYNYSEPAALELAKHIGPVVVDNMWDEYSNTLQEYAAYQGDDDD